MALILGAHVPTVGGLDTAPANGQAIGADAIQVFTRSQLRWRARPVPRREARAFREALAGSRVRVVVAHGSYLVNLASPDPTARRRSRAAFLADMRRCHALGIRHLIFHPGAHLGAGDRAGLAAVAAGLDHVLRRGAGLDVTPCLEVTAGQGSCVGHRFEHLAEILGRVQRPERVGVCLDTCHLLAAGYDIASPAGYDATLLAFERLVGFDKLAAVHLNDAKRGLGSRLDRHAPIGRGTLGLATFRRILADPRFAAVPFVLETPGPLEAWRREIRLLRRLAARPGVGGGPRRPAAS
jgi:deoxyribonuclease-4